PEPRFAPSVPQMAPSRLPGTGSRLAPSGLPSGGARSPVSDLAEHLDRAARGGIRDLVALDGLAVHRQLGRTGLPAVLHGDLVDGPARTPGHLVLADLL